MASKKEMPEPLSGPNDKPYDEDLASQFYWENLQADKIKVDIRFVSLEENNGLALAVHCTTNSIALSIAKEKAFTLMTFRTIIGGVIQNRLATLLERYLLKKAVKED